MKKVYGLIREAFTADEQQDFTKLSINRAVVVLAIPMVLEMFFEALFAIVDAFFVARYVGIIGVATIGLTESVLTIIYSMAWGLSAAATAIVARRVGEKDFFNASKAIYQIIAIAVSFGLVTGLAGFYFADDILRLMGGEPNLISEGRIYTKISFLSSPVIVLLFALSGGMRGAGNATIAMRAIILANVINIALDALFVPVLGIGISGAAYATVIGRTIGVAYLLYAIIFVDNKLTLRIKNFVLDATIIKRTLKLTAGGAGQFIIQSCSWIFLTRILAEYGSEVVAGYTISIRVIIFTILPSWGLANACATLVGQNLGAGQVERAVSSAWRVALFNTVFLVTISVILIFNAEAIIGFFDATPQVVATGTQCLTIVSMGYLTFASGMIIVQALNGAGDTLSPTIINVICFWLVGIPLAYWLAVYMDFREAGVFYSIVITDALLTTLAIIVFRRGKWQTKTV